MVKKVSRRCRYFDDNGDPVRGVGCKRSVNACSFVHPSEPLWADLPPVELGWPTTRHSSFDTVDRPLGRGRRSPPPLLTRMSHRTPRSRSRGRSPGSSNPRYRSRSPVRMPPVSPTLSRYAPSVRPTQNFDPSPDQLRARTDSIASSASFNVVGNPLQNTQHMPLPIQLSRKQAPNPIPPMPVAMQQPMPLPLLPTPPTFLSAKQPPPRTEMSFEEKRKAWAERVQLLSNSLQQRTKLSKLEQEISLISRLSSLRSSTVTVTGPGKQPLEAKLATLGSQREEARKSYDAQLNRVIAIDNWPVVPPADNENRESLNKMIKYCEDLQRTAEEINHILSRSISIVSSSEVKGDSTRPLKRARMEEDGQDGEQARQATADIEELRDRVLAMHSIINSIQNDQIAMRNDLVTEYKGYVDTQFEEATAEVGKHVHSVEDKVKGLEHSINSTGDDVGELAGDVEHLIVDNDAFRAEIAETNQRIKDTQARVNQLEQKVYQITQGRSQFVTSVEALKAAHAAHIARPASPPLPPTLPQIDFIVQSIQDPLLEQARAAIKPMLNTMRGNIETLLQERNTEMYQTLWKRLALTLKVVETIAARLSPSHADGIHPDTT